MLNNKSLNLKNIDAFRGLSDKAFKKLESESKILEYNLGQVMAVKNKISNTCLFLIEGECRLLADLDNKIFTLGKLKPGGFIGLNSLLCSSGIENVISSTQTQALAIPDSVILDLYKYEPSFKDWCNKSIFVPEIYKLIERIYNESAKNDINIVNTLATFFKASKLVNFEKKAEIEYDDSKQIIFAISNNINGKKIGDPIKNNELIECQGYLNGRLIQLPRELLNLNYVSKNLETNTNINSILQSNSTTINKNIEEAPYTPRSSSKSEINYDLKNKIDLIQAKGDIQEALACMQMLAASLEVPFRKDSIDKILRDELRRGKTISIQLLGGIASMMGLHATAAEISTENLSKVTTPCIMKWEDNCCLISDSDYENITLLSPAEGIKKYNSQTLKEKIKQDKVQILVVEKTNITPEKKFGFNWFSPSLIRYKGVLTQVLLASFIVQLFGLANPLLIQIIIDKVISQRSLDTLQILGFALVVVTILGGVLGSLRTFLFAQTTNRIDTRLGSEVIDHLLRLPLNYFDNRPVGELGSRVGELENIRNFLTGQALTTILDAAFSLIYIVVMALYSWLLTFVALAVLPIQILLTLLGTPLIRRQIREEAIENAKTQSHLVEVLTGIQTVKAQNVETVSRWKWQSLYNKFISRTYEKTITGTALNETSQVLQQLSQLLVLWVGASLVLDGKLSLGQLIAFRIISGYVTQPLLRLSSIWQNIQQVRVSFERLADVVDTPEESNSADQGNIPLPIIEGKVEFQDLTFQFKQNQPYVLNNINLQISKGKFVGIVGKSGSGKSTLMKLLPRLYTPNKGKILIDGFDINKVELYSLRRQVGIVPQEPLLFAGSVSENIALTNPKASSEEIIKAAKTADAHDFIMDLPLGYSSNVGERGSGLSGGQRQRIAIARTLLNNPKLLIMDEATSALDYNTENRVCRGLKESCIDSTVFFITHRLSTIKNADIIIMLHEGHIEEQGTHEELMNKKGRYFALYRQQEAE